MNGFYMFILFLLFHFECADKQKINEIWAGKYKCPECNEISDFHLTKTIKTLMVFFIPTMQATDDRYLTCDKCGYSKHMRISEYNKIKKYRYKTLKNMTFPRNFIETDFRPENVRLKSHVIKIVLSSVLFLFMNGLFILSSSVNNDVMLTEILFLLHLILLFAVPLFFSIKGLIPCLKKRNAFNQKHKYLPKAE